MEIDHEVAVFWYKQMVMRNNESTLPGLIAHLHCIKKHYILVASRIPTFVCNCFAIIIIEII